MKLTFIGSGYVGLVSAAGFADVGNEVVCVDKNEFKINSLKKGKIPIYEPGLDSIVEQSLKEKRILFTTDLEVGLNNSEICFITVDTPPREDGSADLTNVYAIAESIGQKMNKPLIVVTKSTVPVGTTMRVKEIITDHLKKRNLDTTMVKVASNPEYLKEGDAVNDFKKPYRVIVGVENGDDEVLNKLHDLYRPFMRKSDRFVVVDVETSELCKYASNCMLATRISFMNSLSCLCEKVGADIEKLRLAMGMDPRIGQDYLFSGIGYGGSCFPKDVKALIHMGKEVGVELSVVESVDQVNDNQREWFWNKIETYFENNGGLKDKKIAIWGVAFKANTDDVRFAPSLFIIKKLIESGASVSVFDPVATENAKVALGKIAENVNWTMHAYECVNDADALVLSTEWREFRSPDFNKLKSLMKTKILFDGRNIYDPSFVIKNGFKYFGIGRKV